MELSDWFKGFEKGIAKLTEGQRETFFHECGKNCVQCGTLQIYKDLYEQAAGDLDLFFSKANKIKDLAPCILVKIVQGHQKGHQKFYEELPIEDL